MASTMTGRARSEELRKELEELLHMRGEAEKAVGEAKGRLFFSILLLLAAGLYLYYAFGGSFLNEYRAEVDNTIVTDQIVLRPYHIYRSDGDIVMECVVANGGKKDLNPPYSFNAVTLWSPKGELIARRTFNIAETIPGETAVNVRFTYSSGITEYGRKASLRNVELTIE